MLGLVCGSFLGLLVFAWNLLRVVVCGFFPLYFGWGLLLEFGFYGGFVWILGFMGALGVVSAEVFVSFLMWASWVVPVYLKTLFRFCFFNKVFLTYKKK